MGSPFFNAFAEERLLPLRREQVDQLLMQALDGTRIRFLPEDRKYISRVTGRRPYLVQMAGATLFDALTAGKERQEGHVEIRRAFQHKAAAYFELLWRYLSAETQQVITILAQAEREAQSRSEDREILRKYIRELNELWEGGFIEPIGNKPSGTAAGVSTSVMFN